MANDECRVTDGDGRPQAEGIRHSAFRLPPEAVEPIDAAASETGLEVYHAEMSGRELRVQVECSAGATVDTCSDYSRALSSRLDAVNFMHRQYILEVSSPGIERKLYRPEDYAKAVGKRVKVLVRGGWVEGMLEAAGPDGVTLRTEGKSQIADCRLQIADSDAGPAKCEVAYTEIREAQIKVSDSELFARSRAERN